MSAFSRAARPAFRRRLPLGISALALTLGALTGCGAGAEVDSEGTSASARPTSAAEAPSSETPAEAGETISLTAVEDDFSISLDQDSLTAGSYEIEVVNDGGSSHDLVVEQDGNDIGATEVISPGKSATLAIDLEPGEYVFYCSVGDHRSLGMEVTVTVT